MSALTRLLFALAAAALLHAACADLTGPPSNNIPFNCAELLIGKRSDLYKEGGLTPSPFPVHKRYGHVAIPNYGLIGVNVVGIHVLLCNQAPGSTQAPLLIPPEHPKLTDLSVLVILNDGNQGPADMLMHVWYYLEPLSWEP